MKPSLSIDLGMADSARQECFGDSFIMALAGVSGCAVSQRRPDDDSIDWTLSCRLPTRPKIDFQVKTWVGDDGLGPNLNYPLKIKNYNDLILSNVSVPRLLLVVCIPRLFIDWTFCDSSKLELSNSSYWVSLKGQPPTTNGTTVTVHLPRTNLLTADELQILMDKVDRGVPL